MNGSAKVLAAERLPDILTGGDTVVIGHGSGWPRRAVTEMARGAAQPIRIVHNRIEESLPYFTEPMRDRVRHDGFMLSQSSRPHFKNLAVDYIPNTYAQLPSIFRSGTIPVDIVILHLSPPDGDGYCSLGTCSAYLPAAAEVARTVVGQINMAMPRTFGSRVHIDDLDYIIEVDDPLWTEEPQEPDERVRSIAGHVASLVDDGCTLQVGIGKLADTIIDELTTRRDLQIYSETFGDAAIRLVHAGATRETAGEAPITATFITGTQDLYEAVDANPAIRILPVDLTNHPRELSAKPALVAVNSAIEIDLTGQVNAEAIGRHLYTGVGGHLDFAQAAGLSKGGRYIVALPSTARGRSRIVTSLTQGSPVTVPRSLAHFVVTEHGVADLKGKTLRQRAESLIAIAAPEHRSALVGGLDALAPAWEPQAGS